MFNTKKSSTLLLLLTAIVIAIASCYKPRPYPQPNPNPERKIQFELFTDVDLTEDNHEILFSLFIEKENGRPIWDSSLASMKIKDIPKLPNKLIAQKILSDTGLFRVGFRYTITNVGFSGLVDTIHANSTFKNVQLSFR